MKVIIIDDDVLVQDALSRIITSGGHEVLAMGSSGEEAISLYKEYRPQLVLMDIRMTGIGGIKALEEILKMDSRASVLLITTFSDEEAIKNALLLGAKGYILKHNIAGILPAIEAVSTGQKVLGDEIMDIYRHAMQTGTVDYKQASNTVLGDIITKNNITDRELQVARLVAEGLSNKEIGEQSHLSEGTVRNYISSLLEKLSLRDRTQLAIWVLKNLE